MWLKPGVKSHWRRKRQFLFVWILMLETCFSVLFVCLFVFTCWTSSLGFFGLPEGKWRRAAYTHIGDINIFGIRLLCEVLASILLNMHECLKWILVAPPPLPTPALFSTPSTSLSNYIITFPSIKIQMNNLNVWQHPGCERHVSEVAFDERCMLKWCYCGKKTK